MEKEKNKEKEKKGNKTNSATTIRINAEGQQLGRLASNVAFCLQGKNKADYQPNEVGETTVIIDNLLKINIPKKKLEQKIYYHHTGYIGHLKEKKLKDLWTENPAETFKSIVRPMLPKNKLRDRRLKKLIINL